MTDQALPGHPIKRETLSDRVAAEITERILSGAAPSGEALPTEPEMAKQFGVSRSVIRDAMRLLSARGLVEIQHGKGMFVTESQQESFAEAFLLALQRDHASAWDAEEFSLHFLPIFVSMATANASDAEIEEIAGLADRFVNILDRSNQSAEDVSVKMDTIALANDAVYSALLKATHNKVVQHLAGPLNGLRQLRQWDLSLVIDEMDSNLFQQIDRLLMETVIACLKSRDPQRAHHALSPFTFLPLPPEAIEAMKETPVGESPRIVLQTPIELPPQETTGNEESDHPSDRAS